MGDRASKPASGAGTAAELDDQRTGIRALYAKRLRGDITERRFDKEIAERTVDLYRARVRLMLAPGEEIEAQHHVVSAHLKLNESVLRESDQHSLSLFATGQRLLRLRSVVVPARAPTCDEQDETVVDEIPLDRISAIRVRRQVRPGEVIAGLVICAVALLFRSSLQVTGTLMVVLGLAGVVHGLLLPTRWIEIDHGAGPTGDGQPAPETFRVLAPSRKSGRKLVELLRKRIRTART